MSMATGLGLSFFASSVFSPSFLAVFVVGLGVRLPVLPVLAGSSLALSPSFASSLSFPSLFLSLSSPSTSLRAASGEATSWRSAIATMRVELGYVQLLSKSP